MVFFQPDSLVLLQREMQLRQAAEAAQGAAINSIGNKERELQELRQQVARQEKQLQVCLRPGPAYSGACLLHLRPGRD